jgi:hypothetical protein
MELVGALRRRGGVDLARPQPGPALAGRGAAVALEHALDGARAGQRSDIQALQLGQDGGGPDQAGAGGRRGVGLEPAADGEDVPLQFGRDLLGGVAGAGQVEQTIDAGLEVAPPPLVEPRLGAAQGRADLLDGAAGEAESKGALARGEFVVHGCLRGAAAGGCPRRPLDRVGASPGPMGAPKEMVLPPTSTTM